MDHKEWEGKANLAPLREFLRRVFNNMGRIRAGRNEFGKLRIRFGFRPLAAAKSSGGFSE